MALQNYQNFIEMISNMIYIVALGGGFKCPRKIHLNTQCPPPFPTNPPKKDLAIVNHFLTQILILEHEFFQIQIESCTLFYTLKL